MVNFAFVDIARQSANEARGASVSTCSVGTALTESGFAAGSPLTFLIAISNSLAHRPSAARFSVASGASLNVGCKHFNKVVYSHFGSQADPSLFDLGNFNPVANFV